MESFSTSNNPSTTRNSVLEGTNLAFPTVAEAAVYFALAFIQTILFIVWIWYLFCKSTSSISHPPPIRTPTASVNASNSEIELESKRSSGTGKISDIQSTTEPQNMENAIYKQQESMKGVQIDVGAKILSSLAISFGIIWQIFLSVIPYFDSCFVFSLIWCLGLLARCLLYSYYWMRIHITFQESAYKMNKYGFRCLVIIFLLSYIIIILFSIFWVNLNECTYQSVVEIIIPAAMNEQIVSIVCVLLFVYKLRKLVNDMKTSKTNQELDALRYLITKLTILACVTVSSGIICVFLGFIELFGMTIGYIGIDMLINNLCLMLSFAFTSCYYQYLCIPCRVCCEEKHVSINDM